MSANELPDKAEPADWLILPAARTVISPTGAEFNFSWGNDAWLMKAGTGKAREPALRQTARHLWEDAITAGPRALISKATIAYGTTEWFPLLAGDIGVGTGTIRDWLRGKNPFALDHPAWTGIDRALARQTERFSKAVSEALLDAGVDFAKTRHSQSVVVETLVQNLAKRGFRIVRI